MSALVIKEGIQFDIQAVFQSDVLTWLVTTLCCASCFCTPIVDADYMAVPLQDGLQYAVFSCVPEGQQVCERTPVGSWHVSGVSAQCAVRQACPILRHDRWTWLQETHADSCIMPHDATFCFAGWLEDRLQLHVPWRDLGGSFESPVQRAVHPGEWWNTFEDLRDGAADRPSDLNRRVENQLKKRIGNVCISKNITSYNTSVVCPLTPCHHVRLCDGCLSERAGQGARAQASSRFVCFSVSSYKWSVVIYFFCAQLLQATLSTSPSKPWWSFRVSGMKYVLAFFDFTSFGVQCTSKNA